jgi:hypothetical protein
MREIDDPGDHQSEWRQHLADRLDPMNSALVVDKRDHRLNGRQRI